MNNSIKVKLIAGVLLVVVTAGTWYLKNRKTITAITHPSSANGIAALNEQWMKYAAAVTARSRAQIDSLDHFYRDSMKVLHKREDAHRATYLHLLTDTTASDSARLHACSVVVLDCEARAELAESQVAKLGKALKEQTALQVSPCGIMIVSGPTITPTEKQKVHSVGITPGFGCRIPIKLPF